MRELQIGRARIHVERLAHEPVRFGILTGLEMQHAKPVKRFETARIVTQDFAIKACRFGQFPRLMQALSVLKKKVRHRSINLSECSSASEANCSRLLRARLKLDSR